MEFVIAPRVSSFFILNLRELSNIGLIKRFFNGRMKKTFRGDFFFEIKLLLQPDVFSDYDSNGCKFSSLALPGGEEIIFFIFFFTK